MRGLILLFSIFLASQLHAAEEDTALPATPPPSRAPARIPSAAEAEAMNQESSSGGTSLFAFFVGGDANFGNNFYFNNVSLNDNGASFSGSANLNMNPSVGLRVGVEMMPSYGFGFQASAAFQIPRVVTGLNSTLTGINTNPALFGSNPTMQFNLIEVDAIYRWHYFYIPLGINYLIPVLSNMNASVENYSATGSVGGQVGAGLAILDGLRVELLFSLTAMTLHASGTDFQGLAYNYTFGTGYMPTGELRAHWAF